MLKRRAGLIIQLVIILGIILGMEGTSLAEKAFAQSTCIWEGAVDSDWFNPDNWVTCTFNGFPSYPQSIDDVIIPEVTLTNPPVLTCTGGDVGVHTLTINEGAQLTTTEYCSKRIYADSFTNNGGINVNNPSWLVINSPFYNNGQITFNQVNLFLTESSSHTGSFNGKILRFNARATEQIHTFQPSSTITVDEIYVTQIHTINFGGTVNANSITIESDSTVNVLPGSSVNISDIFLQNGEYIVDSYTVASGESLSGGGTIQTNLTNSGTVSPGNSPGMLTVSGDYTQEASGTLAIEIGGTTPDTDHDQLVVTGAATLGGTLDVSLINDYPTAVGDSFTIMTYGSHTGSFATLNLPDLDPGQKWATSVGETALTLTIEADGGSISGEVTYTGNHGTEPITVGLFTDPGDAPVDTVNVGSGTSVYPYSIVGIPDGTYYIGALMDLNGNHQPDPDEPFAWYSLTPGGAPLPIVISGETPDHTDIDFQLDDPIFNFIPLFIR